MMTRIRFALAAASLLSLSGGEAFACAEFKSLPDIVFSSPYDPFAATQAPRTVTIRVGGTESGCTVGIGVDGGQNGGRRMSGPGGGSLRYEIVGSDGRPVPDAPATADNGLLVERIPGKSRLDVAAYAMMPPGQTPSSGGYSDQLTFNLYEMSDGQPGRLLDSHTVSVQASVSGTIQSTLVVGGQRGDLGGRTATLEFGELETGKSLTFGLEVTGNTPYQVTLESQNRGHFTGLDTGITDARIPYTLTMDGRTVGLGGPFDLPVSSPTDSGRRSNEHGFEVRVGNTERALAGRYSDAITVTVSAN
ncbi:spore coat protein U domain-containing protein [Azospirillum soli]|uniref:spore coat protein U domain-containing protein n=1 Tax=Azospirillum soli TaxID=1304799 RepID=UPI001AE88732|nr:spore coat protein U domain-containing protein [Azospirillum soli]MBP2313879.1 spore coat protein U-like protein [Azospirillum soli]